jgi:hypothetical protein
MGKAAAFALSGGTLEDEDIEEQIKIGATGGIQKAADSLKPNTPPPPKEPREIDIDAAEARKRERDRLRKGAGANATRKSGSAADALGASIGRPSLTGGKATLGGVR